MSFELDDEAMLSRMRKGWKGGRAEGTVCGGYATKSKTKDTRKWIDTIMEKYDISSVNDAGCGDMNWITLMDFKDYQGYDLVVRHPNAIQLDITTEVMRPCDLIICREVFIHLTVDRIKAALGLFKEAGKYLITTSRDEDDNHLIHKDLGFVKIDLRKPPFNFPAPLERLDNPKFWTGLWNLSDL